ncbi:3-hydroxyacyl-CoA dehydrogenase NAD-binding domain-containing protein [Ruegeria sp. Ofav3-42]|uniref:3-hydroxyacyl-CoA dehydrogenase NAD-binding domain-containing protein n=1 Tax=Ruegeria sp. Ofav3-42 TaxID=2917759 RepID=UPI001EF616EE|nr:3-hydroxyacyl-CoA dehydrogenase NAD-binding domain-containing protein [Ruegeria sp. Ofav3-42]MCG7521991.1 3-hydroxyacyl-CoA dehydrogenase NAD-binding domain-containing protein [Ruegeria sp. Ofav3-42]
MTVTLTKRGAIGVVTINNPPVNALSQSVRQGLLDALRETDNDPTVQAVVLACSGRTFVAGADVHEFGKPPVEPLLPDVLRAIELARKPWVAGLHGTVLGGGLELAMACHTRIAKEDALLGLPEVNLGLIPGAGGTVQLPRLVPAELALDMISGGKPIKAQQAVTAGLIDALAGEDLLESAVELASEKVASGDHHSILDRPVNLPSDMEAFEGKAAKIENKARGQLSPAAAARAVMAALDLPPDAALKQERETFLWLKESRQSRALRYMFFAERDAGRLSRLKGLAKKEIKTVGVVGGGTMGAGIAAACLLAGMNVTMAERDENAAKLGADRVMGILSGSLKRGLISQSRYELHEQNFRSATSYTAFATADLMIEAVFEEMEVKKSVFADLAAVTRPDAILATNTSYLDVNEIARSISHPERVIGLHFFSPAHIMKLLEIVVPDLVSDKVLASCIGFGKQLGKVCVTSGVCDGFIANRIMSSYRRECEYMLEDGALPWEIDAAMVDFGLPMGVFQMQDLAGLDIAWAMRKRQAATRDPDQRYVEIADRICEQGWFGQKTGQGWYIYDGKQRSPNPEVEELVVSESSRKGIVRRKMSAEHIMGRILECMQAEGQAILDEGIARCAQDIDVAMVNAFGFPRWKGGPMFIAETQQSSGS